MRTLHRAFALSSLVGLLQFVAAAGYAAGQPGEAVEAPVATRAVEVDAALQSASGGPVERASAPVPPADGPLAGHWQKRASFLPGRIYHSAVLTYEGMIIWGGGSEHRFYSDGAIYNQADDHWRPVSTENSPSGRWGHAAVWTGREMIVWGGRSSFAPDQHKIDGALYDARTDRWRPMTQVNAPSPRSQMAAVWTGEEMIVWGGWSDGGACPATGGIYHPGSDTWTALPGEDEGAPVGRIDPTFVWTGRELVVWGGLMSDGRRSCGTGGRYDPEKGTWRPVSAEGAPPSVRGACAVWTGREMLIWGGSHLDGSTLVNVGRQTGACYDPENDRWRPISTNGAPEGRLDQGAAWSGTELIVWGGGDQVKGFCTTGGRYDPATDRWTATANFHAPAGRSLMSSAWVGDGVLFFGGSTGGAGAFGELLYYSPERGAIPAE